MILIKIFNFFWKIANKLIYIGVYVESRGLCLASPQNIFFISKLIIIDWSITLCDVTPKSRINSLIILVCILMYPDVYWKYFYVCYKYILRLLEVSRSVFKTIMFPLMFDKFQACSEISYQQ